MRSVAAAVLVQPQQGGKGGFKVTYTPDWSLFAQGGNLAQLGLNLLAAVGLLHRVLRLGRDPGRRRRVQPDPSQRRSR
ncbi:MAG TPA: hypothetical protein VF880_00955 [Actinomycetes bacterium]